MAAVAKRGVLGFLATVEKNRSGLIRLVGNRFQTGAFVAAVAKGLVGAFPAGTPSIGFAFFNINAIRGFLRYDRFVHEGGAFNVRVWGNDRRMKATVNQRPGGGKVRNSRGLFPGDFSGIDQFDQGRGQTAEGPGPAPGCQHPIIFGYVYISFVFFVFHIAILSILTILSAIHILSISFYF